MCSSKYTFFVNIYGLWLFKTNFSWVDNIAIATEQTRSDQSWSRFRIEKNWKSTWIRCILEASALFESNRKQIHEMDWNEIQKLCDIAKKSTGTGNIVKKFYRRRSSMSIFGNPPTRSRKPMNLVFCRCRLLNLRGLIWHYISKLTKENFFQ